MTMMLVARALERIGDNAVDIGEQTAFVVTGPLRGVRGRLPPAAGGGLDPPGERARASERASRARRAARLARRRWQAFGAKPPQAEIFELLRCAGRNAGRDRRADRRAAARAGRRTTGLREEITRREHEGDRLTHKVINRLRPQQDDALRPRGHLRARRRDRRRRRRHRGGLRAARAARGRGADGAGPAARRRPSRQRPRRWLGALDGLERLEGVDDHLAEIRRLEQEGDRSTAARSRRLFDGAIDPMFVIRWKDIYAALEEAIDRCRSAGNSLESIVVKHT